MAQLNIQYDTGDKIAAVDSEALAKILNMAQAHLRMLKNKEGSLPPREAQAYRVILGLQTVFPELI